eukprot:CAMPEP_0119318332 /NCGR_PEP_ID=MMETSP1333-20130426/46100_1 /TAXON_ID=418940 /ORGANISM="Scyphosphaera apsteinii, Strain RCC1455" /LENGTH=594 /DNA_ID=CAMNT_0007324485 /DNA_START=213 /DNA_END=1997 /DNA_ORIENTATION=-
MADASMRPNQMATVSPADMDHAAGEVLRITRFAGEVFNDLGSTSQGIRAAKAHRLLLNGKQAAMNTRVQPGDVVELLPAAEQLVAKNAQQQIRFTEGLVESGRLAVVHEDDMLAVVNKPAGIHSKPFGRPFSLEHALPGILMPPRTATDALVRPTCVHRLDARVSGLIVAAKTRHAAAFLAEAFRERRVSKRYRAIVLGHLERGTLLEQHEAGIGDAVEISVVEQDGAQLEHSDSVRITSVMDGKQAATSLRIIESTQHVQAGWISTIDLWPLTGRRHQLRRHCADLGFPICGDDLYTTSYRGFIGKRSSGLFLQSVALSLPHPLGEGSCVNVQVPEAAKFRRQRERARLGWTYKQAEATNASSAANLSKRSSFIRMCACSRTSIPLHTALMDAHRMSRREALLNILLGCAAVCCTSGVASAAIPSISEYDAVQYIKKTKMPPKLSTNASSSVPESVFDGLRAVQSELTRVAALIEAAQLEDVRRLLRQPLFRDFLGFNPGVRGSAANIKPSAALVRASMDAEPLGELLLDLKRLDDFCLSNRVVIFNQEDLEQVKNLIAAPTQKPEDRFDLEEARALLADAQVHVKEALLTLR